MVGASEHNLKQIDVEFPLGTFICVTGVSGSGKSTLVNDLLHAGVAQQLHGARRRPGRMQGIEGLDAVDKVIDIDQSPIGRTPRSNPATYTGLFTPVRELFASVPESRMRGYKPGRFSFNVKGGRCEACRGDGYNTIEMQFLPDVTVRCEVCGGARYNREALEIRYKGFTIAEILDKTVAEAVEIFNANPKIRRKLETLRSVGLGYIKLGQPATTLSGGEAQRVKLSTELSKRPTGRTLYLLDEPTTGLSFPDVEALLSVLQTLVDQGNTVVVIEHHLDVIKNADWVIDLGPDGRRPRRRADRGGDAGAAGRDGGQPHGALPARHAGGACRAERREGQPQSQRQEPICKPRQGESDAAQPGQGREERCERRGPEGQVGGLQAVARDSAGASLRAIARGVLPATPSGPITVTTSAHRTAACSLDERTFPE